MEALNWNGILIGGAAFIIITILYWVTIQAEYYFSKRFWIIFLVMGLATALLSLFIKTLALSSISAIFGFTSLWAIGEVIEQEKRVLQGRFPMNPRRKDDYEKAKQKLNKK
jgi:hypothetical protein